MIPSGALASTKKLVDFASFGIGDFGPDVSSLSPPPLVWPQWWSFAAASQQGLHFSKKISKRKIIFWFDFHRCSHGSSKSAEIWLSKSIFYVKKYRNLSQFFFHGRISI
jgi:hypothetical protein